MARLARCHVCSSATGHPQQQYRGSHASSRWFGVCELCQLSYPAQYWSAEYGRDTEGVSAANPPIFRSSKCGAGPDECSSTLEQVRRWPG